MQLKWVYMPILSMILLAAQSSAQYTTSSSTTDYYTPPTTTPYDYSPPTCPPTTVIVTTTVPTTLISTITTTLTVISQGSYGSYTYDNSYIPPMKKKTGLIIGLVVGLCGLAILCLIGFLLYRRNRKQKGYGQSSTTYGAQSS